MTRPNLLILIFAVMTFLPAVATAEYTPLHVFSERGDVAEVKRLLDAGADVNAKDNDGRTPLYYARISDYAEVLKLLLAAGAVEE